MCSVENTNWKKQNWSVQSWLGYYADIVSEWIRKQEVGCRLPVPK